MFPSVIDHFYAAVQKRLEVVMVRDLAKLTISYLRPSDPDRIQSRSGVSLDSVGVDSECVCALLEDEIDWSKTVVSGRR